MEKHILSDVDGCLLIWDQAFSDYMINSGYTIVPENKHAYSISVKYGITPPEAHNLIRKFNEGPYIKTLQPLADSVEYVAKLREKGYKFTLITSISNSPASYEYRTHNLQTVFGNFYEELICLEMGKIKTDELKRWQNSGYYWIEDQFIQAAAGHSVGLKPIVIQHPYNINYKTDFHTVQLENAWRDIYSIITKEYI